MNFLGIKVEEYIDQVLEKESKTHKEAIDVLNKFIQYIDRDTDIYSVRELHLEYVLNFLRTLRSSSERKVAIETLNSFLMFLKDQELLSEEIEIDEEMLFHSSKKAKKFNSYDYDEYDDYV